MKEKPYFVMIHNQNGNRVLPMTEGDSEEVAMFATAQEAEDAAKEHHMCCAFGYDIFEMYEGINHQ